MYFVPAADFLIGNVKPISHEVLTMPDRLNYFTDKRPNRSKHLHLADPYGGMSGKWQQS